MKTKNMILKILFIFSTLIVYCHAAFLIPNIQYNFPAIGAMATAQLNNSLIMFGGQNTTNLYRNELYELTLSNNTFNFQSLPQINRPNGTVFGQAAIVNQGNNMFLLGGSTNFTSNQSLPLQVYNYTFATNTWSAFQPTIPTALPLNRMYLSSVYDGNRSVYILGGAVNMSMVFSDFYVMDTVTGQFVALPSIPVQIFGHTMSYISSGKIVVIGGAGRLANSPNAQIDLLPTNSVYVYDIATMQWTNQITSVLPGEVFPSSRANHNAVVSSDNNIYIFGGDNFQFYFYGRQVLNALSVLDTKTWTWNSPIVNGAPPARRSSAPAGLFNSRYLITLFGQGIDGFYGDINVYDTSTNSWLISFTPEDTGSSISAGVIAGVTIVCLIALVCFILLLWKLRRYIQLFFKKVHHDIWKPRTGEPLWAETTRFLFQIFLLIIFVLFLVFVIRQAIDSPNVVQTIQELVPSVDVPDIRFCYDGITPPMLVPQPISCSTDMGYSCSNFIIPLDMSVFMPTYFGSQNAITCYLFRAPADFVLTATSGNNNGSKLFFTYYGQTQPSGSRLHMSFYPKQMNPNIRTYQLYDSIPSLMSTEEVANWVTRELSDQQTSEVHEVLPHSYTVTSYDLIDRRYLQPLGWNYVGFSPVTNSTPQIQTYFREESPNPAYSHQYLGEIVVLPNTFTKIIQRDVKVYTLVNALGFVGGIFGLLIAVQAWLFGYRPRSPWGVVHRWSTGERKRSLLRGLQSKFSITNSGIPLVHPVHHRYSMTNLGNLDLNEPDDQRINRVEDRIQMIEMLFKAYYIDDEVFRSLDDASKVDSKDWSSKQKKSTGNPFEETRDYTSLAPVHDEKILTANSASSINSNNKNVVTQDKPLPHQFIRQNTEESESSNTHLTAHHQRSVSQYQPSTKFQMHEF